MSRPLPTCSSSSKASANASGKHLQALSALSIPATPGGSWRAFPHLSSRRVFSPSPAKVGPQVWLAFDFGPRGVSGLGFHCRRHKLLPRPACYVSMKHAKPLNDQALGGYVCFLRVLGGFKGRSKGGHGDCRCPFWSWFAGKLKEYRAFGSPQKGGFPELASFCELFGKGSPTNFRRGPKPSAENADVSSSGA